MKFVAVRLCIFDVGGVMVDGFDVVPAFAERLGITPTELRRRLESVGTDALQSGHETPEQFWRRYGDATGATVAGEPWRDYFHPTRRPAMYALVQRLKAAGLRVVAGTNTIAPHYRVHGDNGDYDAFHEVYASHLMRLVKPDPEFWRYILAAEGVSAAEAVFIDDAPANVEAARALGLHAVLYHGLEQAARDIESVVTAGQGTPDAGPS
jgi:putative hydrolase of the HAD superfamily